jgi:hypothetical protein
MFIPLSPDELQTWLEWAGGKLLALPVTRLKPCNARSLWPDYVRELDDSEPAPQDPKPLTFPAPLNHEIPFMDEILLLPNLCSDPYKRRLLHARSIVNPITHRCLFHWTHIAKLLQTDRRTVKRWHIAALKEVCERINGDGDRYQKMCRIRLFFITEILKLPDSGVDIRPVS